MSESQECLEWRRKASECPVGPAENINMHNWTAISYSTSDKAHHVSTLMCGKCFHEINIEEAFQYRVKL